MDLVKKVWLFLISMTSIASAFAQSAQMEGTLSHFSPDSLLVLRVKSGLLPVAGTRVSIDKRFQMGFMQGTHGLAEGEVKNSNEASVEIEVLHYSSTLIEDGRRRPMVKPGDELIVKWEGEGRRVETFETQFSHARNLIKNNHYQDALPILDQLLHKDPSCTSCHYLRGRAYQETNQRDKAIGEYTKVIDAHEGYDMAYVWRAKAYEDSRKYDQALADYQVLLAVVRTQEDSIFLWKKIIDMQVQLNETEKACAAIDKIVELEGENRENKDLRNQFCAGIRLPEKPSNRTDAMVVEQSSNNYIITLQLSKTPLNCYYSPQDKIVYKVSPDVGDYLHLDTCNERMRMPQAVVKVTNIVNDKMTVEVMYWTNKLNGKPWVQRYKEGDIITFDW